MRILKKFLLSILVFFLTVFHPLSIFACGMSLVPSDTGYAFGNDSAEQSYINYENGIEKLIISRNFSNTSNTVWVIPIPAQPESVDIDVLAETPNIGGYSVKSKARNQLKDIRDTILSSQLYTIIPIKIVNYFMGESRLDASYPQKFGAAPLGMMGKGPEPEVVVHEHLEKEGMIAEVLSATNSDALYQYLQDKSLAVEKDSIDVMKGYIGGDYSFVASWIDPSADPEAKKGLLMLFPTQKIFYPLKPGSVYAGEGLPETITVIGHVTPELYPGIKDVTTTSYYYSESGTEENVFYNSEKGFPFTRIVINTAPQSLTEDLFIAQKVPQLIWMAQIINLHPIFFGIVMLLIIAFISNSMTRYLIAREHMTWRKFFVLVIVNSLTIIGTIFGAFLYVKEKKYRFIVMHTILFCVITILLSTFLAGLYQ